jgi:predicted metal-dependent peptidase
VSIDAWLADFLSTSGFLEKYPYYAAILARMRPVADPSVGRMAVSLHDTHFYLHVNVESFAREPQFVKGVLLHEVHHVVLGHLTHPKFAACEEPELMDLAIEMSANEHIEELLPPAVTIRAYAPFGVRKGQSTMDRYELLLAHMKKTGSRPRPVQGEQGTGTVDDHKMLGRAASKPGALVQTAMLVERAVSDAKPKRTQTPGSGKKARAEKDDAEHAEDTSRYKVCGREPGRILEELFETTLAPEEPLDYREALAMFAARARAPVHTWTRPSRRFPSRIFEVPGRSWALRKSESPRLLVAIDTSLSMTRPELEEIARQLVVMSERAQVIVAECDTQVSRVYPFAGRIDAVFGRGGTDLRPVFDPALLGTHDVDGVVYFTDGDGPTPKEPPQVPTLWILTKPRDFDCGFGQRAYLRRRS